MFLRFGQAVGYDDFVGPLAIVSIGHQVTIPATMATAEIATKLKK